MLADFIPQILIIIGLAGGMAVLIRRSQTLSDEELNVFGQSAELKARFQNFWNREVLEKFPKEDIERRAVTFAEKTLRRGRIVLIRFDSFLLRLQARLQELKKNQVLDPDYWLTLKNTRLKDKELRVEFDLTKEEEKLRQAPEKGAKDWVNLARLHLAKKNYADARRMLLEAWRLEPDEKVIHTLLTDIHEGEKESDNDSVAST
jgi:hypothetical protein